MNRIEQAVRKGIREELAKVGEENTFWDALLGAVQDALKSGTASICIKDWDDESDTSKMQEGDVYLRISFQEPPCFDWDEDALVFRIDDIVPDLGIDEQTDGYLNNTDALVLVEAQATRALNQLTKFIKSLTRQKVKIETALEIGRQRQANAASPNPDA